MNEVSFSYTLQLVASRGGYATSIKMMSCKKLKHQAWVKNFVARQKYFVLEYNIIFPTIEKTGRT